MNKTWDLYSVFIPFSNTGRYIRRSKYDERN